MTAAIFKLMSNQPNLGTPTRNEAKAYLPVWHGFHLASTSEIKYEIIIFDEIAFPFSTLSFSLRPVLINERMNERKRKKNKTKNEEKKQTP